MPGCPFHGGHTATPGRAVKPPEMLMYTDAGSGTAISCTPGLLEIERQFYRAPVIELAVRADSEREVIQQVGDIV